jgi:hypothetical protein
MIKDPLHNKETPYDILDVTPYADHNEVHQALPRFMRNRKNVARYGIGLAQEAVKRLKNPKDRIYIDIFYYSIGEMPETLDDKELTDFNINEFLSVPCVKEEDIFTDLDKTDFSDEFADIQFNKVKLSDLNRYDDQTYKFDMSLDK